MMFGWRIWTVAVQQEHAVNLSLSCFYRYGQWLAATLRDRDSFTCLWMLNCVIPLCTSGIKHLHIPLELFVCGMYLLISGSTGRAGPWLHSSSILQSFTNMHACVSPILATQPCINSFMLQLTLFTKCSTSMQEFFWYGLETAGMICNAQWKRKVR